MHTGMPLGLFGVGPAASAGCLLGMAPWLLLKPRLATASGGSTGGWRELMLLHGSGPDFAGQPAMRL